MPNQREIDPTVWAKVDRVVLDSAILLQESGDAIAAAEAGTIDDSKISLLGDALAAGAGHHDPSHRTLYKSVGSPLQDLALAALVLSRARQNSESFRTMEPFQTAVRMQG